MCKIQKLIVSYIISSCYAQNNHHDTDMDTITSEPLPVNDHISPVILRLNKGLDEVLNIQRQADDQQVLMQEMSRSIESGDIRLLDNYGCWCNFENNGVRGIRKGLPVDNFDQACKTLHEGYECINMDTNFQCDLKNTVYKSAVGGGSTSPMNLDRLQFECEKSNKAANDKDQQFAADGSSLDCKIKLCKVEGWFIQTIFQIDLNMLWLLVILVGKKFVNYQKIQDLLQELVVVTILLDFLIGILIEDVVRGKLTIVLLYSAVMMVQLKLFVNHKDIS